MKYAIFGAGVWGMRFYARFGEEYDIVCFCDNNAEKQGKKYLGLPVVPVEELVGSDLKVIIPSEKKHFEMAQCLFKLGIKDFYLLRPDNQSKVEYIDLSAYDDLSFNPRRICVIETAGIGGSARAIKKYNPYSDIDIELVECGIYDGVDIYKNGAIYHAYFTSALFVSQNVSDVCGKPCLELWHGFTIKALWRATFSENEQSGFEAVSNRLNNERLTICSYSKLYSILYGYCTNVMLEKFNITGIPRNDLLIRENADLNIRKVFGEFTQKHIVFYLPTHRDYYKNEIDDSEVDGHIFFWQDFDFIDFDNFLQEHDILFITRFHSYETERFRVAKTSNISNLDDKLLADNDIFLYEMLGASDILITDYSSVAADYLLLDKPIVYAIRDVEEYAATRGLMTEPFDAWAPGETVKNYGNLKTAIYDALFGEDKYKDKREQMRQIMHKYHDGDSSRRVLDLARSIIVGCEK